MILNLNEQLLRDTKDAHICIFIANLANWLRTNIDREKFEHRNVREGRCWSYNTIKDFQNYFDFWSIKNIRTIIKHCEQAGLIQIGNFNKHKYDKTSWYTLTDKALEYYPILRDKIRSKAHEVPVDIDLPETANAIAPNGKPIPELPYQCSNINITISDIVETYHQELPELPKVKKVDTKLNAQLKKMVKDWPSYQKDGKAFSIESFRDYLQYLKKHYSWFLKPYPTESGNLVKSSLRKITRELNITRIVNGEFSAN